MLAHLRHTYATDGLVDQPTAHERRRPDLPVTTVVRRPPTAPNGGTVEVVALTLGHPQ